MTSYPKTIRCVLVGGILGTVLVLAMLSAPRPLRSDDKIHVAPPPPPPEQASQPAPTFEYKHEIKKVQRDRKPVIALLRPGDVVELQEYLPFGRGVNVTENVDLNVEGRLTKTDKTGADLTGKITGKDATTAKTGREDSPVLLPVGIRQYLVRELIDSREFVVVERERILEIARELALTKTQAVDLKTAPRSGRLIGVHYIIEGSYFPAGGLPPDDPALAPVRREITKRGLAIDPAAASVLYLTVYKVETGEVKAVACGADLRPLVAVRRAAEDLIDQMRDVVEPIRVAGVNPETGLARLDIGSDSGVKPGDLFVLATSSTASPQEGLKAEVVEVDNLSSVVKVAEGDKAALKEGLEARPAAAK